MISHMFRLVWNKKRSILMLLIGMFLTFIVLFLTVSIFLHQYDNYRKPLGFDYNNVLALTIDPKGAPIDELKQILTQIEQTLSTFPQIKSFSLSYSLIFSSTTMTTVIKTENKVLQPVLLFAGDQFDEVLKIDLVEGRWFSEEDTGTNPEPVIINRDLQTSLFGNVSSVGKTFTSDDTVYKIIGLLDDFRNAGQLTTKREIIMKRLALTDITTLKRLKLCETFRILIRTKNETRAVFEQQLIDRLIWVAKGWTLCIDSLDQLREKANRFSLLLPLLLGGFCIFLITNVSLGFFGVIWYTTSRRTEEIGLRRALGATRGNISLQIVGESLAMASLAIILGMFFIIQFPLVGIISFLDMSLFLRSFLVTMLFLLVLTIICSILPAYRAAKVTPAQALHYE